MTDRPVRIATRGSKLALYQANKVKEELQKCFPAKTFEIRVIKTQGDKILDVALSKIGDKGLFTKELENSLLQQETDLAVHSLKDMPTVLPEGLVLGGILERGEVRDALVSLNGKRLSQLDKSDIVATSSLRRRAQLLKFNPDMNIVDIRGNVDTRLQKMADGYCTAMVMAAAGLQRLGYGDRITEILDPSVVVPAVSQGAIAIEIRNNDPYIQSLVSAINHEPTAVAVTAERTFMRLLEGGCQIPVGCYSRVVNETFRITGFVSSLDGSQVLKETSEGPLRDAEKIAISLANRFLEMGALEIIRNIRSLNNL